MMIGVAFRYEHSPLLALSPRGQPIGNRPFRAGCASARQRCDTGMTPRINTAATAAVFRGDTAAAIGITHRTDAEEPEWVNLTWT